MLFLQDTEGRMADGLSLMEFFNELTTHPGLHSHPEASSAELAEYLRDGYTEPINGLVDGVTQSVPGSAELPAVLAASARNHGGAVPVLDEEGRMTGLIEHKRILQELLRYARSQAAEMEPAASEQAAPAGHGEADGKKKGKARK